jgi:3-hydroxyacyl-CoA dehydrogenase/enoyl-CoA hydratase/3-hydroxybutyryl-CoA epimerase
MSYFKQTIDGDVGTLEFDTPDSSVNILSSAALTELEQQLDEIAGRSDIKVLLITSAKKSIFIAGADIKEIESITDPQEASEKCNRGKQVFDKLEQLPQITVAVINGACLGGGYELSLACDYRVAGFAGCIKIGLPEVRLGILPGFGGCVRLPELIGIANALSVILPGKVLDANRALTLGMVDRLFYDPILVDQAKTFGRAVLSKKEKVHRRRKTLINRLLEGNPVGRSILFSQARKNVLKLTAGHYPAPLVALDTIKSIVGKSRDEAFRLESEGFGKLGASEISKNLIHVFYLDERYRKKKWNDAEPTLTHVKKVGVVGAGVMGGGIAQLLAKNNVVCRIKDLNNQALALALKTARDVYKYLLKTRRMKKGQVEAQMSLISPTTTYDGFRNADVVIEAVVERMDVKKQVFKELDDVVQPSACLFTNTSSLSVTEMAQCTSRPDRVCGFHFFNPVHRMPLLEIIASEKTSEETIATAVAFARQLGKMVIVVKDKEGFIVNRILLPYMNEAAYLFHEGIDTKRLDDIAKRFGMPMGPMELADEVGIDVGYHVAHILEGAYGKRMHVAEILKAMHEARTLGKKSGEGFYIYTGKRKKVSNKVRNMCGNATFTLDDDITTKRLIYVMINEASRCLEEGVVESASTIDVGMIYGTGFPPFRGGLLRYADAVGVNHIVEDLKKFQDRFDQHRFEPSQLLLSMAATNGSFYPS